MYTRYANEISEEDLNYQQAERTSDIQLPSAVNTLLLAVWLVICMVGFFVMLVEKSPVAGTVIIAIPTFIGMIIKPTFALCVFMLVLPTGAGIGIPGVLTLSKGIGIALAISFVLNLLITRPRLCVRNKVLWVLVLYVIWVFFSVIATSQPRAGMIHFFTLVQMVSLVFITYWILETNSVKSFFWVLRAYVIGSLGTIVITFMTGAAMRTMTETAVGERYRATLGRAIDANTLAVLVSMAFLASVYLFARDKSIFWRVIYVIAIVFLPIMVLRTGSRGGLIAFAFTLMSPLLFIKQVSKKPATAFLLLIVIILASGSMAFVVKRRGLAKGVAERIGRTEIIRGGLNYRIMLIKKAIRSGFKKPTGTGQVDWLRRNKHFPHNDIFYNLSIYGVPAGVLFAIFLIMMMLTVRRTPLGIEKLYARAVLTFLLVMGLGLLQIRHKAFWVFMAVAIAAERISWLHSNVAENISDQMDEWIEDIR